MAHYKMDSNATDTTALSCRFSYDNDKQSLLDMSPTDCVFPELLKTTNTNPTEEEEKHTKLSSPSVQRAGPRTVVDPPPPVIPPEHSNRTLVLCFDGTGDQFDVDNSNVVQLVSLLKKGDSKKQLVYYQTGIGTYTADKNASSIKSSIHKSLDEMFAWSIDAHVMGGYEFLMQNYVTGDKICLFGFSRGAYTARSLAGMLYKVGLLPEGNFQQVTFAYKMFTRADRVGWEQSKEFKKAFSQQVSIEFVGVWDTVSSLGLVPKSLPVTTPTTMTRVFRHALSLDERRAKFQPNFWKEKQVHLGNHHNDADIIKTNTDVEEVWFAGCHCDVGGGSVSNRTRHSLARIPLRWMIRECFKTGTGIMFNSDALFKIGLDPSTLHPSVTPRPRPLPIGSHRIRSPPRIPIPIDIRALLKKQTKQPDLLAESEIPYFGTEEEEELRDALSPKYDQLKRIKAWWILEILPFVPAFQKGHHDDVCANNLGDFRPHFGAPRVIPHQNGIKVHRSVSLRKKAEYEDERAWKRGKRYVPKAHFGVEPTWVD